jgi:hypothetical protein
MAEPQTSLFDVSKLKGDGVKIGNIIAADPQLFSKFMKHLSKTVKRDDVTKKMVFLTALSAYTPEPLNLFLRGESSTGKSYNVTETLKYFPREDIWLLGGLSPTALIHDRGKLVSEDGEEISPGDRPIMPRKHDYADKQSYAEALREYKEKKEIWIKRLKNSHYLVDLSGKILVFLESPNIRTFNMLRPILSHDTFQISYKFTDKSAKQTLETQHVVIQGFPATIFCSTDEAYVQDLATRSFTITPETSVEKYKDANILTGARAAFPWDFEKDFDFLLLEGYIRFLRDNLKRFKVAVPYGMEFAEKFEVRFPRSMRDFKHILSLVKVCALFHCGQRPVLVRKGENNEEAFIIAAKGDYDFIMDLWNEIRETTETSAPGHIIKFFHEVVEDVAREANTFLVEDLTEKWNSKFLDKRSSDSIRKWVDFLCEIGWMTKQPDPNDKRRNMLQIIRSEKNGNYTKINFSEIFKLETFKEWLNKANQISEKNRILLRENFFAEGEATPENIFEKFFLYKNENFSDIHLSDSETPSAERAIEKTENLKIVQFPNFNVNDVLKLERLTTDIQDKCMGCGSNGRMDWQVTLHDGTWGLLCAECGLKLSKKLEGET